MSLSTFAFPTTIHFGAGARIEVGDHLRARKLARPLIVTDRGLAALPVLNDFRNGLGHDLAVEVYHGVYGNPTGAQVMDGARAYRDHGADCIIGFGGGAALDVAKAIALMAVHPGDVMEYVWDHPQVRPIAAALPYWIALPTTSGTGSEVGRSSVISDEHSHVKRIIFSPALLARAVFADPELTLDLPAALTAATGMDALTHNIESYLSPVYHPLCDGIALEGLRIGARALRRAVHQPHDLEARGDMMMASMMGAIAFQKDLGAVHSCAHALGTVANMHHGLANALMIDTVMAFNHQVAEHKFAAMAQVVGIGHGGNLIDWLRALKADIGIPAGLAAAGVQSGQIEALVDIAVKDGCHATNPRPCGAADFRRLFELAM